MKNRKNEIVFEAKITREYISDRLADAHDYERGPDGMVDSALIDAVAAQFQDNAEEYVWNGMDQAVDIALSWATRCEMKPE